MKQSTALWQTAFFTALLCFFAALFEETGRLYAQCGQWQPVPSNTTQLLRAVHFPDAQNGWVVGSGGTLLRSADGGASWTPQTTALGAGGRELYSVHFANATAGWVVGAGGFVKKTTDGGGMWTAQTTNTTTDLYDVFFSDANTGWIVGGCGLILRTVNGGGLWTQVSSGQNYHLTAVAAANGSNMAAASTGAVLLQSSNAGSSWAPGNGLTSDRNFRALAFSGATGWAANNTGKVWKTTNGGGLWLYWGPSAPFTGVWQSASATSTSNVYLAGLGGKLVRSTNGGSAWADFSDGIVAEDLYGVQMRDDNTGWAVGTAGKIFKYGQLNAITVSNINTNGLSGIFQVAGGLPQANGASYLSLTMTLQGSPGVTAALTTAPFTHNETVNFTAPQPGAYVVSITDAGGCSGTAIIVAVTCNRQSDSLELVKLYNATDGPNWTNKWDLSKPINTWYGISLNGQGCVSEIRLSSNKLKGNFPDLNLPNLQTFYCYSNQLSGSIPDFTNLPNLQIFGCSSNQLSGSIPDFNNLPNLKFFECTSNQLSGSIPDFKNLPNLIDFNCTSNQLSGSIPDFNNLPNLWDFRCPVNQLNGNIPDFKNLPNLQYFVCHDNQLSGSIPDFNNLLNLKFFGCGNNQLSGSIPDFKNLPNQESFACGNNQLSGSIPDFKNLPNLRYFYCANNQLSGSIPDFNNLPNLEDFICHNNQLSGSMPNFNNLPSMKEFWCYNNQLSGSVPDFNLPNLVDFRAHRNRFSRLAPFTKVPALGTTAGDSLTLYRNQLSFGDILPNMTLINKMNGRAQYTPQDSIFRDTTLSRTAGQSLTIDLGIDAGLTTNVYQWYKNGSSWTPPAGNTTNSNKLIFNALQVSDAGTYHVRVTNPGAPGLTLYGRAIRIQVQAAGLSCTRDSLALVALYNATNGPNWTRKDNWLVPGQPLSAWYGVTTHPDGCVKALALSLNKLNGALPTALGNLAALEQLNLSINNLIGIIPPSLGQLTQLTLLNLSRNQLSGSIPDSLGQLVKLTGLYLNENGLTGSIPASLGNLTSLEYLNLSRNKLGGILPPSLLSTNSNMGYLSSLHECFLNDNKLTGSLPSNFFLPNLHRFNLSYNEFSGSIPPEFGDLPAIDSLFLNNNQLTGCLPANLKNLCGKSTVISVAANSGLNTQDWTIFCNNNIGICGGGCNPTADSLELVKLFDATNGLNWIDKDNWKVSGRKITDWDGVYVNSEGCVTHLNLGSNNVKGNIPNLNLPKLRIFDCSYNDLSGQIQNFDKLPNLQIFDCSNNDLNGPIPNFDNLPNLTNFDCSYNDLSGPIPNFDRLPNLLNFNCENNELSDNIPDFSKLPNLQNLRCSYNILSGVIPNFTNLPNLLWFACEFNQLEGTIPDFSNLTNLQVFTSGDKLLNGSIPNFSKLPNLLAFACVFSQLSGSIPNFDKTPNLRELICAYNNLNGLIPHFNNLPKLRILGCYGNKYTFENILPTYTMLQSKTKANKGNYEYIPQDTIFHDTLLIRPAGQNLDFSLDFDENIPTNVYKWYKDGVYQPAQDQTGNNNLVINNLQASHAGKWIVQVTNPGVPDLTLSSRTITLNICTPPTPTILGPTALCNNQPVSLDAGTGFTAYKWSNGATTQAITASISNTYTVTVTNAQGCEGTATKTVGGSAPAPSTQILGPSALCNNQPISLDAGTGFTAYKWSNGATIQSITASISNTYTVTVTNAQGCEGTAVKTVNGSAPTPSTQILGPTALCNNQPVSLDAGTGFAAYKWSNGATTQNITASTSNTYTVTVTNAQGCEGTAVKTVNGSAPAPSTQILGPSALCNNQPISLDAGTGFTAYKWSNGATTQTITASISNTYTVTVTNAQGCEGTAVKTVNGSVPTPSTQILGPSALCNNQPVSLDAGTGFTAYKWSNGATTQYITASTSNTYTVTVTNAQGCEGTAVKTVNGSTPIPSTQILGPSALCNNQPISLDAGTGFTAYKWSNGATTQTITASISNTYTVTVTNAQGCEGTATKTVNGSASLPSTQILVPTALCNNQPISLDAGTGFAAYKWSNGATTQNITAGISNTYTVTVTNAQGCEGTAAKTVNGSASLPSTQILGPTALCNNQPINLDAGTGFTTYKWSNGATTQNITASTSNTYTVTVTNTQGCEGTAAKTVNGSASLPSPQILGPSALCNNQPVSLDAGTGFAAYKWSNGATTQAITASTSNTYTVTVTNAQGCEGTAAKTVNGSAPTPSTQILGPTALCNNQPVSLDAGAGFTAYKWSNGATSQTITANISNTYTVTITNTQGCEGTAAKTVGGAAPAPAPTFNNTPTGLCTAPVPLDAGSGYTSYAWSNGQSTQSILVSQAGSYRVTVGDAKGCTGTASATLVQHPLLNPPLATAQAAACGQNNGSIALTASGGTLPYRYNWSHNATVQNPAGLSVGPYTATVTDANHCSATATATILNENGPSAALTPTPTRCGQANGSIALALSGGTAPFVFLWNNSSAQGQNPVNLSAGTYTVTIRDARNCETLASATVGASQAPALGIAGPGAVCSGAPVTLRATPGFVNYTWSVPGQTADSLRTSTAGTYTVTATDANSCSAVAAQTVSQAPAPALSIGGATAYCPGVGTVLDAGGNHTGYQWSVPGQNARTLSVNTAGTYTVTVSNAAGCTSSRSVTVREHPAPEAILVANEGSGLPNDNAICEGANVLFSAYGGTQYRFSINGTAQGAASPSALFATSKLADGDVIGVWLLDANGCQDSTILGEPPGKAPIALRVHPYPDWSGGQVSLAKACANQAVSLRLRAPQLPDGPYQVSYLLSGANVSPLITKQVDLNGGYGLLDLGLLPKNGATTCRILALRNAAGCERALTQNQVFSFENGSGTRRDLDTTICTGQVVVVNNRVFAQTGTYSETILRPSGCDSTVVLDLKVVTEIRKELSVSICSGQSYFFNGAARNETGFYRDTLPSIGGCDSLVTLLLSVRTPIFNSISASICAGKAFSVGPKQYTESGNYTDTLKTAAGCDSLVLLRLTVLPPVSSNLSANICAGESFLFGGRPYVQSGRYTDTLKTWTGCDSLAHLDLTVLDPTVNLGPDKVFCAPGNVTLVAETSGCNNCTYQWSSAATHKTAVLTVSPSNPTTYAVTVRDAKGCSNTDQVKVSPQLAITQTATAVLCDGGRYIDGTDTLYRPGDYVLRRTTSAGCDSLIALTLSAVQAQDFAARPDTGYLLPDERSAEFHILANDLFPDDKSLALIEPAPAHGDAKLTKLEQLVYTVYDDDFFGYDTIYYQLCPPQDCPEACDTGMLVLFVQSGKVEDAKKIMPNAFTPNGDGKNDVFDPLQTLEQNGLLVPRNRAELSILNRFGETVFFKRPYEEWDGNSDGRPMPQATYYYLLRFGDAPPLKGPVTLFR